MGDRLPILAGHGDAWWEWRPGDGEAEAQMMADILANAEHGWVQSATVDSDDTARQHSSATMWPIPTTKDGAFMELFARPDVPDTFSEAASLRELVSRVLSRTRLRPRG